MIKGIYKLRTSLGKYFAINDLDIILKYNSNPPANKKIMFKMFTKKPFTLQCLLSEIRCQSLKTLKIAKSIYNNGSYPYYIDKI